MCSYMSACQFTTEHYSERMSLNNESCNSSSDDESFQSSKSIIFSSERLSSPTAWSRSSSMTSGISAISAASSESRKKLKAKFGPITRPATTELKIDDFQRDCKVQQKSSQNSSPSPVQMKSKKKSFLPVQPKIVRPITNMPQPRGWVAYSHTSPMYHGPSVPHYPPPMMYYPPSPTLPPPVQMQLGYPMPTPCSVPMPPPGFPPMYNQPQARYVSVQTQYTYTWTYIDYV